MDTTDALVLRTNESLLLEIALARANSVPIYVHNDGKMPAPSVPGQIGWMEVSGYGWVRMIYNSGLGWMSHDEWNDHAMSDNSRVSSNA